MSSYLASISDSLRLWDFSDHELKPSKKCGYNDELLSDLSWNHSNQVVAVCGNSRKVALYEVNNGSLLTTIPFNHTRTSSTVVVGVGDEIDDDISAVSFSHNSRYLSIGVGKSILVYDLKRKEYKSKLVGHHSNVTSISHLSDSSDIITSDAVGSIKVWNIKSHASSASVLAESGEMCIKDAKVGITCTQISPLGPVRIAAGYSDGSLCIWDPETYALLRRQSVHTGELASLTYSPKNPRLIATVGYDGRLNLIDTGSKSVTTPSAYIDVGDRLTSTSFYDDAIHCAVGTNCGNILVYDWRNARKPVCKVDAHSPYPVTKLAFNIKSKHSATTTFTNSDSNHHHHHQQQQLQSHPNSSNSSIVSSSASKSNAHSKPFTSNAPASPLAVGKNLPPTTTSNSVNVMLSHAAAKQAPLSPRSIRLNKDDVARIGSNTPTQSKPSVAPISSSMKISNSISAILKGGAAISSVGNEAVSGYSLSTISDDGMYAELDIPITNTSTATDTFNARGLFGASVSSSLSSSSLLIHDAIASASKTPNRTKPTSAVSTDVLQHKYQQQQQQQQQQPSKPFKLNLATQDLPIPPSPTAATTTTAAAATMNIESHKTNMAMQCVSSPISMNNNGSSSSNLNENVANTVITAITAVDTSVLSKLVTLEQLEEQLALLRYDMHKEVQDIIREQVRQFTLAKDDTATLVCRLNEQLSDLLAANKELRDENERLRRIY